ncbi:Cyclin-dependent kinases regulatory subunit 2 [Clydaea vesicula]|uniref:Cyclin-dependent kinases regulatory subunit n=1 Tax=Clydaea vesicula TaxID=447962 RepID=A0AAD5Y0R9_9FUNG|nr:Cyclin-dependent kinases regulatory subunit 2 [Clydaea vesicula]
MRRTFITPYVTKTTTTILPKEIAAFVIKDRLMTEDEWRALGVRQSPGWHHYMIHEPEPHILLFKRDLDPEQKLEIQKKKLQNLHNGNKVLNLNNNNKQNLNNDKNDANDKELSDINVGGMAG